MRHTNKPLMHTPAALRIANTMTMRRITIFVACLLNQGAALSNTSVLLQEVEQYHVETYIKADYARQVAEKLHESFKQWFFTIIFCEFTYFENRIVKYTETFKSGYPVLLLTACPYAGPLKTRPKINRHGVTSYVVSSNELSADVNEYVISALVRTGVWKPRSAVVFVINVPVQVDSYFQFAMKNHFQLLWSQRITNSVLVLWSGRLRIYMYNPFLEEIIEVTECNNISSLLVKQYNNLYGKTLRLSVFRKIYLTDDTGPVQCDSRIAKTVMKHFNATCVPVSTRDKSTVGDLLENGTATGVTADLMHGYTDLELSSRILKNSYYGYIDTTYPLMQDELCFIVKKSERQSSFTSVLILLKKEVLAILINFILLTIFSVLAHTVENKAMDLKDKRGQWETVMVLIKCFLRQTVDIEFMGPVYRALIGTTMMYALVVNCVIDGIVTSAITYPRYKPNIDTMSQLAASNLTLGVHSRDMDIFTSSLTHPYNVTFTKKRIEVFNDAKIKKTLESRQYQYAILMRLSDAKYICRKPTNMKDGKPIYHIVQECPVPCFIVYGLDYGSPYLPRLNYLLHHLSQGGILNHWIETDEYTLFKQPESLQNVADSHELKPLCMNNVIEIFYMLVFGFILCIISFIFEIILSPKRCNK